MIPSSLKLLYVAVDLLPPDDFPRIVSPSLACQQLAFVPDKNILELFTGFQGGLRINHEAGVTHKGINADLRGIVQRGLIRGDIVAVETRPGVLATIGPFYADIDGYLRPQGLPEPGYPIERIVQRYEEMVKTYGGRRARPSVFPAQVTRTKPAEGPDEATKNTGRTQREVAEPTTKAERWQERKYLIGKGQRSIYPDARIASERLAENNIAVEKAKLAENVYKNTDPLKGTPGVPEGWADISNDDTALGKIGLSRKMLFDNNESPDFLARVYQPDHSVFGTDMNPTVVFRGSREPGFAEGTRDTIKKIIWDDVSEVKNFKIDNISDWTNNIAQAAGFDSKYYDKAVSIGRDLESNVDISGHSLGGGMASAASMASGKSAWTFNAAGLNVGTVEKYGGSVLGSASNIQAYRVDGELLTTIQEVNNEKDYEMVKNMLPEFLQNKIGTALPFTLKEWGSQVASKAIGVPHTLLGGTGSLLDKHGINQTISLIENEKDDDVATIRSRI